MSEAELFASGFDAGPDWFVPAQRPYVCPVCEGRGHVPVNFYNGVL